MAFLCFPKELKKCGVHEVVRVCEPTYERELLYKEGITVLVRRYYDILSISSKALCSLVILIIYNIMFKIALGFTFCVCVCLFMSFFI